MFETIGFFLISCFVLSPKNNKGLSYTAEVKKLFMFWLAEAVRYLERRGIKSFIVLLEVPK